MDKSRPIIIFNQVYFDQYYYYEIKCMLTSLFSERVMLTEYSEYRLNMFTNPETDRAEFIFAADYINVNTNIRELLHTRLGLSLV